MHRAFKCRLYPKPEQEEVLQQFAGAARFIYNIALEQRRDYWRQYHAATGHRLNWVSQSREVTQLRAETDWLRSVPRVICEQALRDLEKAFAGFFAGRCGYPSMRARGISDSFRLQDSGFRTESLNRKWALIRLAKGPAIKMRVTRPIVGKIRNVTIRLCAGAWYACFLTEQDAEPGAALTACVGIDRGISNTISLSTGEHFQMPAHVGASIKKRERAQGILSRRKKGSARRNRQRAIVAKHYAYTAAARSHWLHERTTDIARRYGVVTLEALRVRNMTASGAGKRGLNRSILEQGWTAFAAMLEYKLAERGGHVEYINPAYTSQSCSECGSVNRESRKSQAVFHCVDCGHVTHADTNAAINILRRSPASVEGAGYGPVEAHIGTMLMHRENLAA